MDTVTRIPRDGIGSELTEARQRVLCVAIGVALIEMPVAAAPAGKDVP